MSRAVMPNPAQIALTDPLPLAIAAALAFPAGNMTASSLRRESRRGRLRIERIAGKDHTTLAAIAEMRERCRVPGSEPGYGSGPSEFAAGRSSLPPRGSSSTEESISPQDALLMKLDRLSSASLSTLPRSTSRNGASRTSRR